jgi:hypothetical protein
MAVESAANFRLTVLNPGGRDPEQQFHTLPGPGEGAHAPVNFHAFAACTSGAFHRDQQRAIAEKTPVLLLLRGDFRASERALRALKNESRTVAVSLKETGLHQIAQQLANPSKLERFMKIVIAADACIATTPEAAELYHSVRCKCDPATVVFIPTPYPIDDPRWKLSPSPDQQRGIFIGTREWDVASRNHSAALLIARALCEETGEPVTVVNVDGHRGKRLLTELKFPHGKLRVIENWQAYPDYFRAVSHHKIILQLDRSHVPGQVAGDALLCRIPCVGGDGAIERIAFPKTCGEGRSFSEIASIALDLLRDQDVREAVVSESQEIALQNISFGAVRTRLANFFTEIEAAMPASPGSERAVHS